MTQTPIPIEHARTRRLLRGQSIERTARRGHQATVAGRPVELYPARRVFKVSGLRRLLAAVVSF